MILIYRNRNTGEVCKRFINPKDDNEYFSQIKEISNELRGFELLDISNFWNHINN